MQSNETYVSVVSHAIHSQVTPVGACILAAFVIINVIAVRVGSRLGNRAIALARNAVVPTQRGKTPEYCDAIDEKIADLNKLKKIASTKPKNIAIVAIAFGIIIPAALLGSLILLSDIIFASNNPIILSRYGSAPNLSEKIVFLGDQLIHTIPYVSEFDLIRTGVDKNPNNWILKSYLVLCWSPAIFPLFGSLFVALTKTDIRYNVHQEKELRRRQECCRVESFPGRKGRRRMDKDACSVKVV